jgi:hypothetical protein
MITPAPGGDPVPSPDATFIAQATALPSGTPIPNFTDPPAPSGDALAALEAGMPPPASYFASLVDPRAAQYPMPQDDPTAFVGTIRTFLADGFVVDAAPLSDETTAAGNGVDYDGALPANSAAQITTHVTNQTEDEVPGGFGALHTGDVVAVLGEGPPAAFTAEAVLGAPGSYAKTSAGERRPAAPRRPMTAMKPQSSGFPSVPFVLGPRSPTPIDLHTPQNFAAEQWGCLTKTASWTFAAGLAQSADYSMELEDVSDPNHFFEGQKQALPVRVITDPPDGTSTYIINFALTFNLGLNFVAHNCKFIKEGKQFGIGFVSVGNGLTSETSDPLPGTAIESKIAHVNCPFFPLTAVGKLPSYVLNLPNSPTVSMCVDFFLFGAPLDANVTVTNAKIDFAPSIPGGSGFTDTTASVAFEVTTGGDPGVSFIPLSSPSGVPQPVNFAIQNMTYAPTLFAQPTFSLSLGTNIGQYRPLQFQVPTPFSGVNALGKQMPAIVLHPTGGAVQGGVH